MSKIPLSLISFSILLISATHLIATEKAMKVGLTPDWVRSRVEIHLRDLPTPLNPTISFQTRVASVAFPSDRIVSVDHRNGDGLWHSTRRISPFIFEIPNGTRELRVLMDVSVQADPSSRPFVSWMERGAGVFILSDLIPLEFEGGVSVDLGGGSATYFRSVDSAVVAVPGERGAWSSRDGIRIARLGEWPIAEAAMFESVREILIDYKRRLGELAVDNVEILLIRTEGERGTWSARTIGSTVVLFSSGTPFASQEIQRFHEQMRHELFHLWIPNSLSLKGDYATFYEGFALYQSLKSGVAVGRIRFADLLSTLSAARSIAMRRAQSSSPSDQWGDDREFLYASGMVSAFITDVVLLSRSSGRVSSDEFLRGFLSENRGRRTESDRAIRNHFARFEPLRAFGFGPDLMPSRDSLDSVLRLAGMELRGGNLSVVAKPTGAQRKVLDRLGYNARASRIQTPIR